MFTGCVYHCHRMALYSDGFDTSFSIPRLNFRYLDHRRDYLHCAVTLYIGDHCLIHTSGYRYRYNTRHRDRIAWNRETTVLCSALWPGIVLYSKLGNLVKRSRPTQEAQNKNRVSFAEFYIGHLYLKNALLHLLCVSSSGTCATNTTSLRYSYVRILYNLNTFINRNVQR